MFTELCKNIFQAVEKFSMNTHEISQALRELCERIQETEFPNDVTQTEDLMYDHQKERKNILDDLVNTITHGEILLKCFKSRKGDGDGDLQSTSQLPAGKQLHITAIERYCQHCKSKMVKNFIWMRVVLIG